MSLLRPLSIFLRNFLVKQHPYFSCCASCGEIRTPLEGRLCTSLDPDFPVDAVLLCAEKAEEQTARLRHLAPWLRSVYVYSPQADGNPHTDRNRRKHRQPVPFSLDVRDKDRALPPDALLHKLTELSEQYLIIHGLRSYPRALHALDFFTPNGIPLVAAALLPGFQDAHKEPRHKQEDACGEITVYGQNKDNSRNFLQFYLERNATGSKESPDAARYKQQLAVWSFKQSLAIPSPSDLLL
ncbi:hypothetical protein LJC59_06930 [Desulfovibrio sp. OttesenSCG-928-A18]|nr:hypothetical protein [Desulfovibrio sp. OttesenSCG-928-A18]